MKSLNELATITKCVMIDIKDIYIYHMVNLCP